MRQVMDTETNRMISTKADGGFVVDTPSGIALFRLLALRGRLHMEGLGLKARGRATSTILREEFGWKGRGDSLMRQLENHIEDTFGPMSRRYTTR